MSNPEPRVLVCCFTLPTSLQPSAVAEWIAQTLSMHAGVRVAVVSQDQSLRIFADDEESLRTVRTAVDTNRDDWTGAGVIDIRPSA